MNILILGINGPIGRNIAFYFKKKYPLSKIVGIDRSNNNCDTQIHIYDILDNKSQEKIFNIFTETNPDIIINLMSKMFPPNGEELYNCNPKIAFNICTLLRKYLQNNKKNQQISFLHVGSAAEYGLRKEKILISEDDETIPETIYGETKLLQTLIFKEFSREISSNPLFRDQISIKIARIFNVVCKDMRQEFFFPTITKKFLQNDPKISMRSLLQTRDYLHIDDIVPALEAILLHGQHSEIYNVSSSFGITAKDVIDYLQIKTRNNTLNPTLNTTKEIIDESNGDSNFSIGNNSKLRDIFCNFKISKSYTEMLDELIATLSKTIIVAIITILTFTLTHSNSAYALAFVDELTSPITTKARQPFLIGSGVTSISYFFKNNISKPFQEETIEKRPLGENSRFGDILGQLLPNGLYFVAAGGYGLIAKNSVFKENAILMFYATIYSGAMVNVLKYTIREKRPDSNARNSFPSGHATTAFAFAAVVAHKHAWYWGTLSYIMATFVGYSRINDNRHWLHDVIAGATLGIGYGLGIAYVRDKENQNQNQIKTQSSSSILLPLPTSDGGGMISYTYRF
ncbi:MAG: NAD-dependent epimerase/dehydratase family protein [Oligoflexia bacterium]|nr:NAD-dependent epimerase/dehydratase family protein [Oligoflexia bacterium]